MVCKQICTVLLPLPLLSLPCVLTAPPVLLPAPSLPQRLIVVANRLPVSAYKDRSGRWQLQASRRGLGQAALRWLLMPGRMLCVCRACCGSSFWASS